MLLSDKKISIIHRVNYLIFIVYVLVILEGAIRKWALPQFSSALFFIKDPFVIYIYWLCFYYKLFPRNFYFVLTMFMALLFYFLMSLQSLIIPFNILAGIYGWRTYFFFLPLAFIIGELYGMKELKRIARFTCIAAIPICILTFIQYRSPLDSYINKNVGLGESIGFTVIEDIVRPSGTFSFTTGQTTFISTVLLMLLYNFFLKKEERFLNPVLFCVCIFAFFANLAVSGSRAAYVSCIIILLFLLLASFILLRKKQGFSILTYLSFGLIIAVLVFSFIFEREWDIINRRQAMAEAQEGSIFTRMASLFIDIQFFKSTNPPLLGYGLGLSSGGGSFLVTGISKFGLAETDWARNVLEAGLLLGTGYIFYRIFLTIDIVNAAIKGTILSRNPAPFLFLGFVVPSLLIGSITGNGTSNIYNWLFVGFAFAVNRIYLTRPEVEKEEDEY
jgi:hypothetical protein